MLLSWRGINFVTTTVCTMLVKWKFELKQNLQFKFSPKLWIRPFLELKIHHFELWLHLIYPLTWNNRFGKKIWFLVERWIRTIYNFKLIPYFNISQIFVQNVRKTKTPSILSWNFLLFLQGGIAQSFRALECQRSWVWLLVVSTLLATVCRSRVTGLVANWLSRDERMWQQKRISENIRHIWCMPLSIQYRSRG